MKIHDITGYEAGWTWRSVLRGIAVCSAALCMTAACSREEAVSDPVAVGMYDGPLTIRADIGGMLETRATYPKGNLQDNETWVLSSEGDHYQEFFKADFSKGYGEFKEKKDKDERPVEIKWSRLTPMEWGDYIIGLDNGPIGWKEDGGLNICYIAEKGTSFVNLAYEGDAIIEKYKAQVEPENGMARNDFISGRYQENRSTALNKNWITIQLRHRMSRVHVEITAPIIQDLGKKDVQVWMAPLAEKCYGIERVYGDERIMGQNHPGVSIDKLKWVEEQNKWILDPDESGEIVFRSKLYLLGSAEESELLLPVEGEEETFRTHYLIMPPQTTHLSEEGKQNLRPKLYVKIGGTTYSGVIPGDITVEEGNVPKSFTEFGGGQNITLKVRIDHEPPVIDIKATVRQWEDMGTWLMGTDRGGIRNEQDFKAAVTAFKEYVTRNPQPQWTPGTEKPEPLERYGDFLDGKFVFRFFGDLKGEIPDDCKISGTYKDKFEVDLNGHNVYGVDGVDGVDGSNIYNETLKTKMLSYS